MTQVGARKVFKFRERTQINERTEFSQREAAPERQNVG